MNDNKTLVKNFEWYKNELANLAKKYPEKFIAIKDCKVLGAYDTFLAAIDLTEQQGYELGTFIVQKASTDPMAYTRIYHNNRIRISKHAT